MDFDSKNFEIGCDDSQLKSFWICNLACTAHTNVDMCTSVLITSQ